MLKIIILITSWIVLFTQANDLSMIYPSTTPRSESAYNRYSDADSLLFLQKADIAAQETTIPAKSLTVAKSFLGTPYVSGCLDRNTHESLIINLRELDCWTLVELSVAISSTPDGQFDTFMQKVQQLRYWGGQINGFGSRQHYFTGWVLQAEKLGFLDDITQNLGGKPYSKLTNYITSHSDLYPKSIEQQTYRTLLASEKRINAHQWYYIPKANIKKMENLIQDGDILMLTSGKAGLDIAHEGFAVRLEDGRVHLLHASSLKHKVIISPEPLSEYMVEQKGQTGIMVARLK